MNKESSLSTITQILSILASIFIIINVIRKEYPTWLLYIAVGLIIIISFVSIYPRIKSYIFSKLENRRKNRLTQKYFPEFVDLVERFSKYMDMSRYDNIPYLFKEIKNTGAEFKNLLPLEVSNLTSLFYDFKDLVRNSDKSKENLVSLVKTFYRILIIYNNDYVCSPASQIKESKVVIYESYMQRYKEYKHGYLLFLEELKRFGEEIQKTLKDHVSTHFQFPVDL